MITIVITPRVHRVSHFCTLRTTPHTTLTPFLTVSGGVPPPDTGGPEGPDPRGVRPGRGVPGGVESPLNNVFFGAFGPKPSHDLVHGGAKIPPPHPPLPPLPRHHFGVKRVISPGKRGPKMGENGGEMCTFVQLWGGELRTTLRVGCGHFAPTRCKIF